MDDASRAESELADPDKQYKNILLDTRLNNRVLDLRVSSIDI
jgi:aspartyl-tRNA synthetase